MSLVPLILRIATVHALRGATFADGRVHDSMIDAADLVSKNAEPFIVVAVDSSEGAPTGRDLLGVNGSVQLTLDLAVATRVVVVKPKPPGEEEGEEDETEEHVVIPHTDAGMEITLDLMTRQMARVFVGSQDPWAALWRRIVTKIEKVQADRGASAEDGVRYASRQIILTLNTLAEPSFGPAEDFWRDALALMRTEPPLLPIADLMEAEIESAQILGWRRAMGDLGLGDSYSLGGEPLLEDPPEAVTGISIDDLPGVDAQTIEDALGPDPEEES